MPYIEKKRRDVIDNNIKMLIEQLEIQGWNPGDVNYVIFKILRSWFNYQPRYHTICSIMGTLSSVSKEFYRKVATPYEEMAEKKNGPIT